MYLDLIKNILLTDMIQYIIKIITDLSSLVTLNTL